MSYNQEYNKQPLYELDFQYSEDSESDTTILSEGYPWGPAQGPQG